jgi:hypothetical protein
MTIAAHRLGEEGFAAFLGELVRLGVLTRVEKIGWLRLHGSILRLADPLGDGVSFNEKTFSALLAEFEEPTE